MENLTLVAYAIILLSLLVLPIEGVRWPTRLATGVALQAMMAREANLHEYIEHISIFKLQFWTDGLSALDKLYALFALAPIAIARLYGFIRYARPLLRDIVAHQSYATTVATFVALIFITNVLDCSLEEFKETLVDMRRCGWGRGKHQAFLELLLSVFALTAGLQYRRQALDERTVYGLDILGRI